MRLRPIGLALRALLCEEGNAFCLTNGPEIVIRNLVCRRTHSQVGNLNFLARPEAATKVEDAVGRAPSVFSLQHSASELVFWASDDSSYITGTELFVDGGFAQV